MLQDFLPPCTSICVNRYSVCVNCVVWLLFQYCFRLYYVQWHSQGMAECGSCHTNPRNLSLGYRHNLGCNNASHFNLTELRHCRYTWSSQVGSVFPQESLSRHSIDTLGLWWGIYLVIGPCSEVILRFIFTSLTFLLLGGTLGRSMVCIPWWISDWCPCLDTRTVC